MAKPKMQPTEPRGKGRPTKYKPKLAQTICALIGEGTSLRKICKMDGMPDKATVFRWLIDHEDFCDQYARAKEHSTEAIFEEMLDIADDGTNDYVPDNYQQGKTPGFAVDQEHIQRSKLRIDTRKWILAKLKPKKYGDKIDMTSDGDKIQVAPIYGGMSNGDSSDPSN